MLKALRNDLQAFELIPEGNGNTCGQLKFWMAPITCFEIMRLRGIGLNTFALIELGYITYRFTRNTFCTVKDKFIFETHLDLNSVGKFAIHMPSQSQTIGKNPIVHQGVDLDLSLEEIVEELNTSNATLLESVSEGTKTFVFGQRLSKKVYNPYDPSKWEWQPSKSVKIWVGRS